MKTASFAFLALFSLAGSTCRGQSGTDDASKGVAKEAEKADPSAAADLPGIDTSTLTTRERKEFGTYVSEFLAPCADTPVPIAQCVTEKRACSKCLPAAKVVLKGVREGMAREQVEALYKGRFAADTVKNVPIDGSPTTGPDNAPVTIVEFADFECPMCGRAAPLVHKVLDERKNVVRFVFKELPLPLHTHAEGAARAAIAAHNQGKFWQMHQKLFDNQRHLEAMDIEGYAKDVGLDLAKLRADMKAPSTTDRIERDKKLSEAVQVKGTPTLFINGREFTYRTDFAGELLEWIDMEAGLNGSSAGATGGAPAAVPAVSSAKTADGK